MCITLGGACFCFAPVYFPIVTEDGERLSPPSSPDITLPVMNLTCPVPNNPTTPVRLQTTIRNL